MPAPLKNPGSVSLTRGIRVAVAPSYAPEQSDPALSRYLFTYRIRITNESPQRVRLLSRHWIIVDAQGHRHEVEGEGVIGQQPDIGPGESFAYSSFCPLQTPWGTMEGTYTMHSEGGEVFEIQIGRFFLTLPADETRGLMRPPAMIPLVALALAACASTPRPFPIVDADRVPIVYGGGAAIHETFRVSGEQWGEFVAMFDKGSTSPAAERAAIRVAIGRMEQIAGEQTITWMDKAKNGNGGPTERGQLDCIDESTNTNVYLHFFEQRGLLRYHRVLSPVWRAPHLIDTHRTAVIQDTADGRRYAVDSWFLDNGFPAYVQPLDDWIRKVPFPPD